MAVVVAVASLLVSVLVLPDDLAPAAAPFMIVPYCALALSVLYLLAGRKTMREEKEP